MKRRILCFVLTMAMVLSMLVVVPAVTVSADTYDASDNPVRITTTEDFVAFRDDVNNGNTFEGKVIKLYGDIDLSGISKFNPVAKNGAVFCGSFDGQGHTITGLTQPYGSFTGDGGLFGFVQIPTTGGEIYIKNLKLTKKGSEKMSSSSGGYCAGTVVSIIAPRDGVSGTFNIENVYSSVDFDSSGKLMSCFGGILGTISGTVSQRDNNVSYSSGTSITVNIDSCQYAGNAGSPTAGSTWYGGIMGCNNFVKCYQTVNITNCLVTGEMHIWGSGGIGNYDDNGGIMGYIKGNNPTSPFTTTVSLCNNVFAGTMIWRNDSNQTGGAADQGYILGEITSNGALNSATLTNNYYVVSAPQGGLTVTAGLGAGSSYGTITNLTEKTMDGLKALTASDFTDGSKWHFESGKVPQPASIYETFFEGVEEGLFDDLSKSEFVITNDSQMAEFQTKVNSGVTFAGKTIKLGADVNLNGRIGATSSKAFSGNFDGQGHTVTITQSISNPDGNGGLFDFVRIPANGTVTIKDVHVTGTITLTNSATGMGYTGGLISAVDANTSGNGGTINITNVWNTVRINGGNSNAWNALGGFIGFVRHADGLKQITINIDSCLWDGVINCGPAIYHAGGFIGYTGNNKADRQPTINITNSVAAGTIMANIDGWNQQFGTIAGFLKGSFTDGATAKVTANVENVISVAKATFANPTGSGSLIGLVDKIDGTTELNLSNIYYKTFDRPGVEGDFPVVAEGAATTSTNVVAKTTAEMLDLTASAFSDSTKWSKTESYYPCPAGIVNVFGSTPSSLYVEQTDIYVGTAEALNALASAVNGGKDYEGKTIHITADITIESGWTSIGITSSKPFSGNFNGHGHTIEIHQTLTNPDGIGGLIGFVRTPASGTSTIENVHLTGRIDATNTNASCGYFGGVASCVDANTSGTGGTINFTNVWNSLYINCGNANMWTGVGGFIGFVRHADGLKALTINFDSCVWDGTLNVGPAAYHFGGFVGYTGNNKAGRTLVINIENSVAAGKIALNSDWNQYAGLLVGYLRGGYSSDASAKATVNVSNVVSNGTMTFKSGAPGSGSLIGHVGRINDDTTNNEVNFTNLYYNAFDRGVIETPAPALGNGTATTENNVVAKDAAGFFALTPDSFTTASKWTKQTGYNVCPAGIVTTFGVVPASLEVDETQFIDEFEIGTVAEFIAFRDNVNAGKSYSGKTVKLTADIDLNVDGLNGENDWVEIGRGADHAFKGTFDGQGHTINLVSDQKWTAGYIDTQGGLFGHLNGATVKNLVLTGTMNLHNNAPTTAGETDYIGSIAGAVTGTTLIQNVYSSVNIETRSTKNVETNTWPVGIGYVAGLVGFIPHNTTANITIDSCVYAGTINAANQAKGYSGIMAFTGNGGTKTVTITGCVFSGKMTLNENAAYAFQGVGGIFGLVASGTVTITDTYSAGKIYFNTTKGWPATDGDGNPVKAGQIVGYVNQNSDGDDTATLVITDSVTYTPAKYYTAAGTDAENKYVLPEIGRINGVYGGNGGDNSAAVPATMEVSFGARNVEDTYKGIRFTATFTNVGACTGGGTASANFGIYLMTLETYTIMGGTNVTKAQLDASSAVVQVKATKFQNNTSSYVVNAVVFNLNTATRQATELVAIPYAGNEIGEAASTTYNALFN